jgi:hypothetical protein
VRISIEGPAIRTPEFEELVERLLDHWSGLKERRIDRNWEVPSKLALARRARKVKQNVWKKKKEKTKAGCRKGRSCGKRGSRACQNRPSNFARTLRGS